MPISKSLLLILFLLSNAYFLNVDARRILVEESPLTAKAAAIRYWKTHISNDLPKPWFLLNKTSPLDAVNLARFSKLAEQNSLSTQLPAFCSKANILCFPEVSPSLEKHTSDVDFASYGDKNFTNYGSKTVGGLDSFKHYDLGFDNSNTFRRYSRGSTRHDDKFSTYAPNTNVVDQRFNTYGTSATSGSGEFKNYNTGDNVPTLGFTSYSDSANGRDQGFSSYADSVNAGDQSFTSYAKNGNGAFNEFKSYGNDSNVVGSHFNNYGDNGNGGNEHFTSYGDNGNNPQNDFRNYGSGGGGGVHAFTSYRDHANVGDDSFTSYDKGSVFPNVTFTNYGQSFNNGTDTFIGYGEKSVLHTVAFKTYGFNNTFKEYAKDDVTFSGYNSTLTKMIEGGKEKLNRWIEPGKFFREENLVAGNIMPMPDIRDKMPKRSFLPRPIVSKLPFSSTKTSDMQRIFKVDKDSTMGGMIKSTLGECERAPSKGETKRCVASVEDMVDFATSVLGRNVVVRTTESTAGSKGNILIGRVKGINGGKVTQSVSCHQSMFPYLVYYCHSVPKVRVYEADILDPKSKEKINHGVAICHVDTSSWSPTHGAFLSLGSSPGKIEVCHWIFENDMTWATAD